MARVTIEDCLLYVPNRFKIVELAAKRAREIASGAMTTVDGDTAASHKSTVLALKEIATGNIDLGQGAQDFAALDLFEDEIDAPTEEINTVSFEDFDQNNQAASSE